MMMKFLTIAVLGVALTACGETGANYRPVVDGPRDRLYAQDLSECRHLARERGYLNDDTKTQAGVGAVLGGLVGAVSADDGDEGEGAIVGAAAGALIGAGSGAADAHGERKNIVIRCLRGRGHRVVG